MTKSVKALSPTVLASKKRCAKPCVLTADATPSFLHTCFAGHVPAGFKRLFPAAKILASGHWCGFTAEYSEVPVVDAADPLFTRIGKAFTQELVATYGTDHYYNGDTFNEMAAPDISLVPAWGEAK